MNVTWHDFHHLQFHSFFNRSLRFFRRLSLESFCNQIRNERWQFHTSTFNTFKLITARACFFIIYSDAEWFSSFVLFYYQSDTLTCTLKHVKALMLWLVSNSDDEGKLFHIFFDRWVNDWQSLPVWRTFEAHQAISVNVINRLFYFWHKRDEMLNWGHRQPSFIWVKGIFRPSFPPKSTFFIMKSST